MQLSCPKCATGYTLDERLLPPGGAPVQCTQCGLVFTASPTGVTPVIPLVPTRQTQVFGAASSPEPLNPDLTRRTQVFGRPVPPPATGGVPATALFGGKPDAGPPLEQPVRSTMMFGTAPPAPAFPPPPAIQIPATGFSDSPHNKTQIFGRAPSIPPTPASDLSLTQELAMLDQVRERPSRVNRVSGIGRAQTDEAVDLVLRAERRRRRTLIGIALACVLLVAAGLSARWIAHRAKALPLEVVTAREAAFDLIRRDDPRSRNRARDQLKRLSAANPDAVDIRADEVLALALELDELKLRIQHLKSEGEAHNAAIVRLQEHQTPAGWKSRVHEHRRELEGIKAQSDPLISQAEALDGEVNGAFKGLNEAVSDENNPPLSALRAQAVYFGVKGSDQAVALAERYRRFGGQDGWDAIAYAEYALNARVAPETQKQALGQIEALKAQDKALLRSYVLAGRLKGALHDTSGAAQELEAASALNPHHDTARELLSWQYNVESATR